LTTGWNDSAIIIVRYALIQENKLLDSQLDQLLTLLGLYAHEEATHLVLEYLIRRYRIHEMNAGSLIRHMLIMHDTKVRYYNSSITHYVTTLDRSQLLPCLRSSPG